MRCVLRRVHYGSRGHAIERPSLPNCQRGGRAARRTFAAVWRHIVVTLLFSALLGSGWAVRAATGAAMSVRDLNGRRHDLLGEKGKRATLLFFIAHDCPIANSYAQEINRICAEYRRVECYVVYVEPDLAAEAARRHARAYGYAGPAVLDPDHVLVKKAGATVTPEAALFTADGRLVYRGRIDNRYFDFGKSRSQPTSRDLRRALACVVAGKPVPIPRTKAIGCFIEQGAQ